MERGIVSPIVFPKHLLVSVTKAIRPAFAPAGTEIPAAAVIPLSAKMQASWAAVGSTALAHIVFVEPSPHGIFMKMMYW